MCSNEQNLMEVNNRTGEIRDNERPSTSKNVSQPSNDLLRNSALDPNSIEFLPASINVLPVSSINTLASTTLSTLSTHDIA